MFFVLLKKMYSYHATPWSPLYDERDRITHHKRTKQRDKEEQRFVESRTRDERLDGKTSWTWEEVMAGDKTLPWKQVERAQEERRRYSIWVKG